MPIGPTNSGSSAGAGSAEARPRTFSRNLLLFAGVACVTLLALLVRFHRLDAASLWSDEGVSVAFARLGWYDFGRILWRREANMALYYLLLRGWLQVGDSEAWLRGFSALASAATVPLLYATGKRMAGAAAGLGAALLLALHAYHVIFAQEARSYSLVTLLVVAGMYFLVRALDGNGARDWKWYTITTSLAIYAHFFAVLVVIAVWVALVGLRYARPGEAGSMAERLPAFRRAAKRIGLYTLPVWIFIIKTGAGPVAWVPRTGASQLREFVETFTGMGGRGAMLIYGLGLLLAVAVIVRGLRSEQAQTAAYALLALCWFIVPVVIALVFSLARPVFYPRFLLIALPGLILSVVLGLRSLRRPWLTVATLALVVVFSAQGLRWYFSDFAKQDFRGATAYIVEQARPGDAIFFHRAQGRFTYDYYAPRMAAGRPLPAIVFPGGARPMWRDFMPKFEVAIFEQAAREHRRIWAVNILGRPFEEDRDGRQIVNALSRRDRLVSRREFAGVVVDLYEAAPEGANAQ